MPDAHALTADDIVALRTAEDFYVMINMPVNGQLARRTVISCSRRAPEPKVRGPFRSDDPGRDLIHRVGAECATSVVAHFHPSRLGAMQAVGLLARPGDRLVLDARQNNNGYLNDASHREAPLHHDVCYLSILRPDKKEHVRTVVRKLVIADSICPANTARAIRGDVQVAS